MEYVDREGARVHNAFSLSRCPSTVGGAFPLGGRPVRGLVLVRASSNTGLVMQLRRLVRVVVEASSSRGIGIIIVVVGCGRARASVCACVFTHACESMACRA